MGLGPMIRTDSRSQSLDDRHQSGTRELDMMMMPSQDNLHAIPRADYELIAAALREAAAVKA